MKKPLSIIILTVFLLASSGVFSNGRPLPPPVRHSPHMHYHGPNVWGTLGVGLLTGAVIGSLLTPAPAPAPPLVIQRTPAPVVVETYPVFQAYAVPSPVPSQMEEYILRTVVTTAPLLNMRSGPGVDSNIIGRLSQGTALGVIGAAPKWLYVKTQDGKYGWVMSNYTREDAVPVG